MKTIFYLLPWELPPNSTALRPDQITQITREVYGLAADESVLLATKDD